MGKFHPITLVIFFLMITAALAPLAFFVGKAKGESDLARLNSALLENETTATPLRIKPGQYGAAVICDAFDGQWMTRRALSETFCHPFYKARSTRLAQNTAATGRNDAHLSNAVVASIAGSEQNSGGSNTNDDPLSLALAPTGPTANNTAPTTDGPINFGRGPSVPYGGGLPQILAPLIGPTSFPTVEDPDTDPALVTPIPAALPLMLTGFAGLLAAARRKRQS